MGIESLLVMMIVSGGLALVVCLIIMLAQRSK